MKSLHLLAVVSAVALAVVMFLFLTDNLPGGGPVEKEGRVPGNYSGSPDVNGVITAAAVPAKPARGSAASPDVVEAATARPETGDKGLAVSLPDLLDYEVGDEIDLLIPQEELIYRGRISSTEITGAGNRVVSGFFDGDFKRQRFIFTVGTSYTFGTLQTANGRYQLKTSNGIGRIISTAVINEKLDFSLPDFVIPERREQPLGERRAEPLDR